MSYKARELAAALLVAFSGDVQTRAALKRAISGCAPAQLRHLLNTERELEQALAPLLTRTEQRDQVLGNLMSLISECLAESSRGV